MRTLVAIGAVVLVLSVGALSGVLSGALMSSGPTTASRAAAAAQTVEDDPAEDQDEGRTKGKKDKAQEKDQKKQDKADKHRQQRAFVTAKKVWSTCVAESAPQRGRDRFDPEQVCGTKPHPHDLSGKPDHGRPAWAGGPDRRRADPPGHARSS